MHVEFLPVSLPLILIHKSFIHQIILEMKRKIYQICILLLLLLWVPVVIDKILNFNTFRIDILNQPFDESIAPVIYYSLPFLEGAAVLSLIIPKYQKVGFILSSFLLISFTVYVSIAMLGLWDKIPCGCGALIAGMSWTQHFFFNLFFLFISFLGLHLNKEQNYFNK